jgi:hypothetical protein
MPMEFEMNDTVTEAEFRQIMSKYCKADTMLSINPSPMTIKEAYDYVANKDARP